MLLFFVFGRGLFHGLGEAGILCWLPSRTSLDLKNVLIKTNSYTTRQVSEFVYIVRMSFKLIYPVMPLDDQESTLKLAVYCW